MATPKADPASYGPSDGVLAPVGAAERGVAAVLASSADGLYIAYGSGPNVIVRAVADPARVLVYAGHGAATVKCAKFSPSGAYVASGDDAGRCRVWAFTHAEHPLKYELPSIGGAIEDLAWDGEGKRIAVVGGGQAKAKVFAWDAGSSLAPEVVPHAKKNLCVDLRPARPYRAVWGGEDFALSLYAGPPFKFERSLKEHTNFVNCVRYAPDGSKFVSVASDRQGLVYDGTTGELAGRLDPAAGHAGSVYHCAWAPDGLRLATSGADKSVKLWDMAAPGAGGVYACVGSITLGTTPDAMQNSVTWPSAGVVVSLSLDGTLNFLRVAPAGGPPAGALELARRLVGHQAPVCALHVDRGTGAVLTGDMAGRVCVWRPRDEARTLFDAAVTSGETAPKKAACVALAGGGMAVGAWDDQLRVGDAATGAFTGVVALPGQPKGVAACAAAPDVRVVVTSGAVLVVVGSAVVASVDAPWTPTCVSLAAGGSGVLAVGGADKRVHLFALGPGGALTAGAVTPEAGAAVSAVAVSPDGARVALGDATREVRLYATADGSALVSGRWMAHTTRVTGLAWSPSGGLLASVSSDRRLCVWAPGSDAVVRAFDLAHPHPFVAVDWLAEDVLLTAGADGVVVRRALVL